MPAEKLRRQLIAASVFQEAAEERWKDAIALHKTERFDGAIYLCGYVLECFLKFILCEKTKRLGLDLHDAKRLGHNLVELLDRTGLREKLFQNKDLWRAFESINNQWSPEIRCRGTKSTREKSEIFLRDTRDLRNWLLKQLEQ